MSQAPEDSDSIGNQISIGNGESSPRTEPVPGAVVTDEDFQSLEVHVENESEVKHNLINHYNRIGFYGALERDKSQAGVLDELLQKADEAFEVEVKQVEDQFDCRENILSQRIERIQVNLKESVENLRELTKEQARLEEKSTLLLESLVTLRKNIQLAYEKLGLEKSSALERSFDERLKSLDDELKKIIRSYQVLAESKHDVDKRIFDDNKEVFDLRVKRFDEMRSRVQKSLDVVHSHIERLHSVGLTALSVGILNGIGTAGLAAAGWFYSEFLLQHGELKHTDYFTFLINRIVTFGDSAFANGNPWIVFTTFLGGLIGLLSVTALVVWLCHKYIERKSEWALRDPLSQLRSNEEKVLALYTSSGSRFAVIAWIQTIPYMFVVGLVFILVSMFGAGSRANTNSGAANSDLSNLMTSLTGQVIGAAIALLVTGIATLYIAYIVEPRIVRSKEAGLSLFRSHWEIALTFLLTIGLAAAMFFVNAITPASQEGGHVAAFLVVMSFIACVLFTAFTLGYGIQFRGLINESRKLERQVKHLSHAIEDNSKPRKLDTNVIDARSFRRSFISSLQDLFSIVHLKNRYIGIMIRDHLGIKWHKDVVTVPERKDLRMNWLARWFFFWKKESRSPVSELQIPELTTVDERLFPESYRTISDLREDWKEKRRELENALNRLEELKHGTSSQQQELQRKVKELDELLRRDGYYLYQLKNYRQSRIRQIEWTRRLAGIAIRDGFELGCMFRSQITLEA